MLKQSCFGEKFTGFFASCGTARGMRAPELGCWGDSNRAIKSLADTLRAVICSLSPCKLSKLCTNMLYAIHIHSGSVLLMPGGNVV